MVLRLDLMLRILQSEDQNLDTKCLPLSETMSVGMPCFGKTCIVKILASWGALSSACIGMNRAILVRQSTMTSIMLLDSGSHSMKSIEIELHGRSGMGKNCSGP